MKDSINHPLNKLNIFSLKGVQMKTFHITWLMFFICFFGWFGMAPLMPIIRDEFGLSKAQIGNLVIISVSTTIIGRLVIGRLCDRWGARKTAVRLLIGGSLPVMLVGLADSYSTLLLFRGAIGLIGSAFVITQYHTSLMFAPKIKGTASALTGGWGNLGGGVTNIVMPLIFAAIVGFGYTSQAAWRYAMIFPGLLMWGVAWLYYRYTKDTPQGNFDEINRSASVRRRVDWSVLKDWRIWALTLGYGVCFGVELTFDNIAALYFVDTYELSFAAAGLCAGIFGAMNLFARAVGGIISDKRAKKYGLRGRGKFLAYMLFMEGVGLLLFAEAKSLPLAIVCMLGFALFLKMANGATYGIVPFINKDNGGLISGIVGAGGNLGGMLIGFLFKSQSLSYANAFYYIAIIILCISVIIMMTRFTPTKYGGKLKSELAIV